MSQCLPDSASLRGLLTATLLATAACSADPVHTDARTSTPLVVLLQGRAAALTPDAIREQHDALFADARFHTSHHDGHAATLALAPPPAGSAPQLLFVDQLDSEAAAKAFAKDSAVLALFGEAPTLTLLRSRNDWESWGGGAPLGAATASPRYFVPIRGTLASAPDSARATHDGFFAAGRPTFEAAGYARHHAYTVQSADDQLEMLGVWTSLEHLQAAATNPMFGAFLTKLFTAPPEVTVFAGTDWLSWGEP